MGARYSKICPQILYTLDCFRGMVDVYNYIIRVVNILTFIYFRTVILLSFSSSGFSHSKRRWIRRALVSSSLRSFSNRIKKKNPKLDDAAATKAAMNSFLGTMWLVNSNAPQFVTDNLVQAHISGNDTLKEPLPWCLSSKRLQAIQVVPPLPWLEQTKPAVADTKAVEAEVAEAAPDEAWGGMVADERNQAGQTYAIDAAVARISTQHALMMLTAVEKKRIPRWPIQR